MSKIRLNTEYRNKFFNKIKDVFFKEDTQEGEAFLQSREDFKNGIGKVFETTKAVVQRHNPLEDVETCRRLKRKYGTPLDVVAKDKCFFMAHSEDVDEDNEPVKTDNHFDFGLYGSLSGSEYGRDDDAKSFAYAYNREELLKAGCNPDIMAQQKDNQDNPHKTKHMDANDKALGYGSYSRYNSDDDSTTGITKNFDSQFYVDIIGTSHCRSRAIPCTKNEYQVFMMLHALKAKVVSTHQTWIASVQKQLDQVKAGLKAYRYMNEAIEFCEELGVHVDEAEMVRSNSTGLTIYEPKNLANLIKGMKNKNVSREAKILARREYEEKQSMN
jgi:hypothetical protein|tara:strand:- start:137 stop:1120 length:984 start_codon:yes stop_codon:yes gene_type:complete